MRPQFREIFIRPTGVWNTRSPLQWYLTESSMLQRNYALITGAIAKTRYDATHNNTEKSDSGSKFMRASVSGKVAAKAWKSYQSSFRAKKGDQECRPTIGDIERDLAPSVYAVREYAVVQISGLFEAFVQCWAANYLIAILEADEKWTKSQSFLADEYLSSARNDKILPYAPRIFDSFHHEIQKLRSTPHIFSDPKSKTPVEKPVNNELNALRVVFFWRSFRNCIVHTGGVVDERFVKKNYDFFEMLREPYADILAPLAVGRRLQLPDAIYYAMTTTHKRAAIMLNDQLIEKSNRRRGLVYLPEEEKLEPENFSEKTYVKPMFIPGDHLVSLEASR